ncbi:MAG TPA: hypothetical protein PK629_06910 [Oscillospiraceae bacterium]|nr:hypothetical protein [Oscillospiraceae bacterium]HPF55287.1 hypothetical protein [Clostridiales bacterium]HPK34691.1 hypothetical protein [Oscillospiraceae bacterium]HPR74545.1 hypothetical protein [Oscillospiraceae bacterium]
MRELIGQVSENLKKTDFDTLWKGFHRYPFALYDEKKVYLENGEILRDERFFGNTAIEYEGGKLAIWNIEGEPAKEDAETLTADMVHEMFHAFQYEKGEKRFPNDLKTLLYPSDIENFNLKYIENKLLADAFETTDLPYKRQLLNQICGLRQKRRELIGEMIECEYFSETFEGMAEYIGTSALKILSDEKYTQRCKIYIRKLRDLSALQFDIRRISYYSGAVLLLTVKELGIDFHHDISGAKQPVWGWIADTLSPELPKLTEADIELEKALIKTRYEHESEIEEFIHSFESVMDGDFLITGYDPMNMIRVRDYILCKTFVRLTDNKSNTAESLMGQTLLEMVPDSENRVKRFFRK